MINNKGKVRLNILEGMVIILIDEVEEVEIIINNKLIVDNYDDSVDLDEDFFEFCESDFLKSISNDGKEISE